MTTPPPVIDPVRVFQLTAPERPAPGAWSSYFFARIGPTFTTRIILDIGCSDASLLTTIAPLHPALAFIGLDTTSRALHTAAQRHANTPNLSFLRARAQDLDSLFSDGELSEIWLFHPDPFASPGNASHRLFRPPFLHSAHRALRPAGLLTLKTDHPHYYTEARALIPSLTHLFDLTFSSPDFWNDASAQSHAQSRPFSNHTTTYESRYRRQRTPIHYMELQRSTGVPSLTVASERR